MNSSTSGKSIIDRSQNFRWNSKEIEKYVREHLNYFGAFETIRNEIIVLRSSDAAKDMSHSDFLFKVFSQIYRMVSGSVAIPKSFFNSRPLGDRIYEACLFTTLCTFLHSSKRIGGKALKDFLLCYHPSGDKNSWDWDSESDRLRQSRHRLFSIRETYIKNTQWNAMSKDSEHEWAFYYALRGEDKSLSEVVIDTYKRIGNLYKDIYAAFESKKDDRYKDQMGEAYKKFRSKLGKIKYENYLELQKAILTHIDEDKEYYGLNIYRLEKEMRPYITIHEVNRLSMCQSDTEKALVLMRFTLLSNIWFPKIYDYLASTSIRDDMICAKMFPCFLKFINLASCLFFDELVEKGAFGNNWEDLFRSTINKMTERVFYKPSELEFSVTPESQKNYMDLISAPVIFMIHQNGFCNLDKEINDSQLGYAFSQETIRTICEQFL